VVTLARNGRVAEDTRWISRLELIPQRSPDNQDATKNDKSEKSKAEEGDATQAVAELLTVAAACILFALSERHPELRHGLCGAKKWRSIALHAIATTPSPTQDEATKEQLLAAAVDADPANLLAQVALVQTRYRKTYKLPDQHKLIKELDKRWAAIEQQVPPDGDPNREVAVPDPGYGALQLRLLFSRAAVRLNVQLLEEADGQDVQTVWTDAYRVSRWLVLARLRQDPSLVMTADADPMAASAAAITRAEERLAEMFHPPCRHRARSRPCPSSWPPPARRRCIPRRPTTAAELARICSTPSIPDRQPAGGWRRARSMRGAWPSRPVRPAPAGAAFDLRDFHAAVLDHGSLALPVLSQVVEAWIASVVRAQQGPTGR